MHKKKKKKLFKSDIIDNMNYNTMVYIVYFGTVTPIVVLVELHFCCTRVSMRDLGMQVSISPCSCIHPSDHPK